MFTNEEERTSQGPRLSLTRPALKTSGQIDGRNFSAEVSNPRKRRREDYSQFGDVTSIQPYPTTTKETLQVTPHFLTSRTQLPLHYLDPRPIFIESPSRLCSGLIPLLTDSVVTTKDGQSSHNNVLIASVEGRKGLFVIENVQRSIFSICGLVSWAKEDDFEELIVERTPTTYKVAPVRSISCTQTNDVPWWTNAVIKQPAQDPWQTPKIADPLSISIDVATQEGVGDITDDPATSFVVENSEPVVAVEPSDCVATLVGQYLDTLYLSKAPLAFFAKGPLARARALLQPSGIKSATHQLAEFVRPMILGLPVLDKKYKDKLPVVIKAQIDAAAAVSLTSGVEKSKSKIKKLKKLKPSKEGLYSTEQDMVAKWWAGEDEGSTDFSSEERTIIRERLAKLRMRETLLQLTLILEVLSLEAQAVSETQSGPAFKMEPEDVALPPLRTDPESTIKTKRKSKKPTDLQLSMEMIVDRLCIWQSVEADIAGLADSAKTARTKDGQAEKIQTSSDQLKEFCIEVAIPFYKSRIPEIVGSLGRKLGLSGWSSATPAVEKDRPRLPRIDSKDKRKLAADRVPRRSAATSMRPPSMMRSATDSLLQAIQREKSSTPQGRQQSKGALSRSNSITMGNSRSSATPSTSVRTRREIDLDAMKKFNESKLARKAAVSQELQAAIATLKRPNRGIAVGQYFEERGGVAAGKTQAVQIDATPRKDRRTRDVIATTPQHGRTVPRQVSPSPVSYVVQSHAVRPAASASAVPGVVETPSRRVGKHADTNDVLFKTPLQPTDATGTSRLLFQPLAAAASKLSKRDSSVGHPLTVPAATIKSSRAMISSPEITPSSTPPPLPSPLAIDVRHEITTTPKQTGEDSIYQSLGWDYED